MPNYARLYRLSTTSDKEAPVNKQPDLQLDAALVSQKLNWLNSTQTQEVFKDVVKQENDLIDFAVSLSSNTSAQPNVQLILQVLVRVDTLRKWRADFGK